MSDDFATKVAGIVDAALYMTGEMRKSLKHLTGPLEITFPVNEEIGRPVFEEAARRLAEHNIVVDWANWNLPKDVLASYRRWGAIYDLMPVRRRDEIRAAHDDDWCAAHNEGVECCLDYFFYDENGHERS